MVLKQAGPDAENAGRWYYKCTARIKHPKAFIWCDEFPPNQPLDDQEVSYASNVTRTTNVVRDATAADRLVNDNEKIIAYIFMGVVIFLLGVVIGKLS